MHGVACNHESISRVSDTGDESMDVWGCDNCAFHFVPLTQKLRDLNDRVITPIKITATHPQRESNEHADDVVMKYIKKALTLELSAKIVDMLYGCESYAFRFYSDSTELNIELSTAPQRY